MNIAIVGFDYDYLKELCLELSKKLNLTFIDFKKLFENYLLETGKSIFVENEILQREESKLLNKCLNNSNSLTLVLDDVVFSNKNYKYLKNNFILFIYPNNLNNFQKNLKKLIKNKINMEINQEKINIDEIINNIRGYYDR